MAATNVRLIPPATPTDDRTPLADPSINPIRAIPTPGPTTGAGAWMGGERASSQEDVDVLVTILGLSRGVGQDTRSRANGET